MEKLNLVAMGGLFWLSLLVFALPSEIEIDLSKESMPPEQSRQIASQEVETAEKNGKFYFLLDNDSLLPAFYQVNLADEEETKVPPRSELKSHYVGSRLRKCIELPLKKDYTDVPVSVYIAGYLMRNGQFYSHAAKFNIASGHECKWSNDLDGGIMCMRRLGPNHYMEHILAGWLKFHSTDQGIPFQKRELTESKKLVLELKNALSEPFSVALFCTRLVKDGNVYKIVPPPTRQKMRALDWEEIEAGKQGHFIEFKQTWIQFKVQDPWEMRMRGKLNGNSFCIGVHLTGLIKYDRDAGYHSLPAFKLGSSNSHLQLEADGKPIEYSHYI